MAVGFLLKYYKDGWRTISNPKFVFTSPNMDDQCVAGTRSHVVAGEAALGTWLEDVILNKMWKFAHAQDESLTWETIIHEYNYTDYRPERLRVAVTATTPFNKIYLSERPTVVYGQWFPNPSKYSNRFDATRITYSGSNWWKLDESDTSYPYPDFADSLGSFNLVSSGSVIPVYYPFFGGFYAPGFTGTSGSLIYSNDIFPLGDSFCFSAYVDSYGTTSTGIDSFGYNSTFFNVVTTTGTYFSVGCSDTNTITYSMKTDVAEYKSDTGSALSSGTLTHLTASYDKDNGLYIYKNNNIIASNASVTGTVGYGHLCIGNTAFGYTSTFRGCVDDIKYWDNHLVQEDVNEINLIEQFQPCPICMFGSSVGDYEVGVSPNPAVIDNGLFYGFPSYMSDSHHSDTLTLFMTLGEAYNCYITAWDDATHSTVLNSALKEELCKITACVYRSDDVNTNGNPDHDQNDTTHPRVYDYVSDYPIKGNELYYGKFNLVYYVRTPNVIGDMVSIRPRISTVNSTFFDPGVHNFVITLHYQYT